LYKLQLIKPEKHTQFKLLPDAGGRGYAILALNLNSWQLYNDNGDLLHEAVTGKPEGNSYKFFNFGAGNIILAVHNPESAQLGLYNSVGKPVGKRIFTSNGLPSILFNDVFNRYYVYLNKGQQCMVISIAAP
jgi:hypothetical protein